MDDQPPPPPPFVRPPVSRISSWQRVSPPGAGSGSMAPPPPPPPPPHSGHPSEPRSGNGVFTPDMLSEVRKFMDAGGYEGMKRRILEEVGEQLKGDSDRDSDRDSVSTTGPSPSPPAFPRHQPSRNTSPRSGPPAAPGPSLPHTPPDSPHSRPQNCHPARPREPPPPPTGPPAQKRGEAPRIAELSPVDRCWGELFDANGNATKRLGQVLRGLANYLISQDAPSESVVISPSKLSAFYTRFAVKDEPHPYAEIFTCDDDKESYLDITHLYEDLECEYHLTKLTPTSRARPVVPSLTPSGFVKWCVTSILAYPDAEAARLGAVMERLPVEVEARGKSERLPKQLSRHLFPVRADKAARRDLYGAVEEVLYERGVREKKARETEYGSGGVRARPVGKRSESEPLPQRDTGSEDGGKKRGTKYVSFERASSRAPEYISTPASSRRPGERTGRPCNLTGRPSEDREPSSPQFELSSGRDRDRDRERERDRDGERNREYGRDSARRGSREDRDRDRDSGRKRRRRRDVVVEQEREPSWMKILREVSSIYD